jgi:sporulation protein YlmC with PRC-barrel domain
MIVAICLSLDRIHAQRTASGETATPSPPQGVAVANSASQHANGYAAERLGLMMRSSKLLGLTVRDSDDHKLGKIEDLLVDLKSGRVLGALVTPSEFIGGHDYQVAVPAGKFATTDKFKAVLDIAKSDLMNAPHYPTNRVEGGALAKFINESCNYFHEGPASEEGTGAAQILKCSALASLEVNNKTGEGLGKVLDWMIDLPAGRLLYAVITMDGTEDKLYATPPAALTAEAGRKVLLLDADKTRIATLARHNAFFWTDLADATWATANCETFGQRSCFCAVAAPTATSGNSSAVGARSDPELTQNIIMALVQDDVENAFLVKHLKISAQNGRVTLAGKVKSEKQKSRLAALAEGVAGAGKINNLLTVK